ncbi:MAG: hypothetical protein Q4P66_03190 [Actinomycetaceae bacterium]|nr:hypothetical protein [Actinomycetaceae bacterium]
MAAQLGIATEIPIPPPPKGYRSPWKQPVSQQDKSVSSSIKTSAKKSRQRRLKKKKTVPDAACPLRPGEPCTLCQAFCSGPHDCQTVKLVMDDPQLRALMVEKRKEYNMHHKNVSYIE